MVTFAAAEDATTEIATKFKGIADVTVAKGGFLPVDDKWFEL